MVVRNVLRFHTAHGRPQKFFQGWGQRRHFADPFQVSDNAMQMDVTKTLFYTIKTLSTIYTAKQIPRESTRSVRILFEIVFRWRYMRVCRNGGLSVFLYSFCWIGYNPLSLSLWTAFNWASLNWTWTIDNYVCGALISLCGLILTSQSLVWNVL